MCVLALARPLCELEVQGNLCVMDVLAWPRAPARRGVGQELEAFCGGDRRGAMVVGSFSMVAWIMIL